MVDTTQTAEELRLLVDKAIGQLRVALLRYLPNVGIDPVQADASGVISSIIHHKHNLPSEEPLKRVMSFVYLTKTARNTIAHFKGRLEIREARRYLDAIIEVLRAIGAETETKIVEGLYLKIEPQREAAPSPASGINVRSVANPAPRSQADSIRAFAFEQIDSARRRGEAEVTLRAGDIHREMGLRGAVPSVCQALGGQKLQQIANVELLERSGPHNSTTTTFRFATK